MTGAAVAVPMEAFAFTEELARVSNPGEIVCRLQVLAGGFGFRAVIFSSVPDPGGRMDEFLLGRTVPPEWHKLYAERLYRFDPAFLSLPNAVMPYEYDVGDYAGDEAQMRALVEGRRDFGLRRGFVVPVHQPNRLGYVWMSGDTPDLSLRTKAQLHLAALCAFGRIRSLLNPVVPRGHGVTLREREVLTWVAAGKTAWEISEILGIAKRTVDEHVRSAARKLRVVNRTQAVAIALRERLISI